MTAEGTPIPQPVATLQATVRAASSLPASGRRPVRFLLQHVPLLLPMPLLWTSCSSGDWQPGSNQPVNTDCKAEASARTSSQEMLIVGSCCMRYLLPLVLSLLVTFSGGAALASYIDNGDGTLTDTATGLIWMRCAIGTDVGRRNLHGNGRHLHYGASPRLYVRLCGSR